MRGVFFLFLGAFLCSCAKQETLSSAKDADAVLFKIGSVYLTREEMESRILELGPEFVTYLKTSQGKKAILDVLIRQKILARAAYDKGLHRHQVVKEETARLKKEQDRALRLYREGLLINLLLEQLKDKEMKVTEEEIAAYYNDHRNLYGARHILLADKQRAEALFEDLKKKGAVSAQDFGRLAQIHSLESQSAREAGRLPPFLEGEMEDSFTRGVHALGAGQISGPVETKAGYHLIYLESTTVAAFNNEYQERVRRILERKKLENLLDGWRNKYVVEVKDETLRPYIN
ncbi:MAG: peptidylprolyl isomerase [Elusimicrobia bacterium]|nr:peptidylprolyl isomerase [Elusimicrobiota bacterium]